jgi:aromatic-L-amino-acid/L-tryptophan decarboxylase
MSSPVPDAPPALPFDLLAREVDRAYAHVRELPVTPQVTVDQVRDAVAARFDLEHGRPLAEVFAAAADLLHGYSLQVTHPRYFGLFNPSVHPSSVLADALVALYNPQVGGWSHAPAGNELERLVLQRLAQSLGFAAGSVAAHFTSGGNEANHTAVLAALAARYPRWDREGLRALDARPVILLSEEAHHSFVKIARAVGLGTAALRHVPVDEHLRMRPDALADTIARTRDAGEDPCMVVATVGTTGAGAVDPVPAIADLCAREGTWLHVDAAWGGAVVLAPRLAAYMDGASRADSLTWDAHKWLSIPLGAGMLFCRHEEALGRAFGVDTGYIPPTQAGAVDLYKTSMQWSRRLIGLKLLFAFAEHGVEGMGAFVDHQARMGDLIRTRLADHGWLVVNSSPFPLVCFTHPDLPRTEEATRAVVDGVLAGGRAWISSVRLPAHGWVLRACVTSFRTDAGDVEVLMEELLRASRG